MASLWDKVVSTFNPLAAAKANLVAQQNLARQQQIAASQPKIKINSPYKSTNTVGPGLGWNNDYATFNNGGNFLGIRSGKSVLGLTTEYGGGKAGGGSSSGETFPAGAFQEPSIPNFETVDDNSLNEAYSGAFGQLDSQARSLMEGEPITIAGIKTQGEEMKSPYTQKEAEGTADLERQTTQTKTAEGNAMAQARQLFNELTQFNTSRFGAGSSAGQAAMELLGRSTQGQIGNITNTSTENLQKIADAGRALKDFVSTAKINIDKQVTQKVDEAKQWFRDKLAEINSSKAMLESDKASKRYEALRARADFVNNIKAQDWNYKVQLKNWYDQTAATLTSQAKEYEVADTTPTINNILSGTNTWANTGVPRTNQKTTPQISMNYGQDQYAGGFVPVGKYGNYIKLNNGLWVDTSGRRVTEEEVAASMS
jgi:hypothetical protein